MFSVVNRVGRLVELTIVAPVSLEEATRSFIEARTCVNSVAGGKAVTVADLRGSDVFSPEVADKFTLLMRAQNLYIQRSATLVAEGATASLQFLRMVREAGYASRRVFKQRHELETWLGEVLTRPERERLHAFLDERGLDLRRAQ